jgi:hypothetical protein
MATNKGIPPGEPDKTGNLPSNPTPARASTPPGPDPAQQERKAERAKTDAQLDEALKETFPASDPPAHNVPIRPGPHRRAGA